MTDWERWAWEDHESTDLEGAARLERDRGEIDRPMRGAFVHRDGRVEEPEREDLREEGRR